MCDPVLFDHERVMIAYVLYKRKYWRENQSARYASIVLMLDTLDCLEHVLQEKGVPIHLGLIVGPSRGGQGTGANVVRGITITIDGVDLFIDVAINSRRARVGRRTYNLEHKPFDETLLRAVEFEIASMIKPPCRMA